MHKVMLVFFSSIFMKITTNNVFFKIHLYYEIIIIFTPFMICSNKIGVLSDASHLKLLFYNFIISEKKTVKKIQFDFYVVYISSHVLLWHRFYNNTFIFFSLSI